MHTHSNIRYALMPYTGSVQVCDNTPHNINVIRASYEYNVPVRCVELNESDKSGCVRQTIVGVDEKGLDVVI
jgi:hypothetical protein